MAILCKLLVSEIAETFALDTLRLIEHLFEPPAITGSQFAEMGSVPYNTARADIVRLVNAIILSESEIVTRPKIYFAPDILEIAYGE